MAVVVDGEGFVRLEGIVKVRDADFVFMHGGSSPARRLSSRRISG